MRLFSFVMITLVAILAPASAAPTPKDAPRPKAESAAEMIRKVLESKVNIEFNGLNLPSAIAQLSEDHRVNFVLDKAIIQQMGFEPNDIMVDVKLKDVKLRNGLRTMLGAYNLTFAIVGETVLVTTEEQAIYKQLKHRISVDLDNVPLAKALKDLSTQYGINVVIDPKAVKSKAAENTVSLSVDDVPIEAAVRLMCEMAGLKPARMGNVIYVTTEDRADKLKDSDSLVPNPSVPGGGFAVPGGPGGILPGLGGGANGMVVPLPAPIPPAVEDKPVQKPIER